MHHMFSSEKLSQRLSKKQSQTTGKKEKSSAANIYLSTHLDFQFKMCDNSYSLIFHHSDT